MNDLSIPQGEINTSWGIGLLEAMNAMGKAASVQNLKYDL